MAVSIERDSNYLLIDWDVLHFTKGDWKAACFLARVLELQSQANDRWAVHSWPQWESDYFTRAEVERCIEVLSPLGLIVQNHDINGRSTRHYRIDTDVLTMMLQTVQPHGRKSKADYSHRKERIPAHIRRAVFERDSYQCQSCGAQDDLTLDHIVPEKIGGAPTIENLRVLCRSCNCKKGTRY
jgi:5-methylcytosine-specific restriction endonuclease McrA